MSPAFLKEEIERTLIARLAQVVARDPRAVALRDEQGALTYGELARSVVTVAAAIRARLPEGELPVALLLDHGAPAVVALLGVIAAGHPYVPLDPAYPPAQLEQMLADCGAGLVIAEGPHLELARALSPRGQPVDLAALLVPGAGEAEPLSSLAANSTADSNACILYTSGSTGVPKGTVHTHRSILHLIWSHATTFGVGPNDHLALVFSLAFAASISEVFGAVLTGASLSLINAKKAGIGRLADWVRNEQLSVFKLPVSLFRVFLRSLEPQSRFPGVRLVLLGGDALFRKDVEKFRAHFPEGCRLVNRLTSTESLSITRFEIDRDRALDAEVVPVGYPDHDAEVEILDDEGRVLPAGELGQIAVRSRYLSPGYWRREELTRATFVPGPPGDARVTLMTGDLGTLRPDGALEHFGRRDQQVKVRGFRVELSAVEAALSSLENVQEAAAGVEAVDGGETKRLVGYLVPSPDRSLSVGALRKALAKTLPDFMIPSTFVVLEKLPLTATGKVDRRALPSPSSARALLDGDYLAPRTGLERQISAVWAEVLGRGRVGVRDNFFDLGGDSLLLLRAHARLCEALGIELAVVELFANPTVAAIAGHLASRNQSGAPRPTAVREVAPLVPERAVAIIGMAGVFPGARDIEEFWANLRGGVESIRALSDEELRQSGVDPASLADPDYVKTAPEPLQLRQFDAAFFGLPPLEAAILDPQHRLLLECAWRALEHAGRAPGKVSGRIGVFAGASPSAYLQQNLLPQRDRLPAVGDLQLRLATEPEFLATRIAYKLDLKGPALTVNTACSTALVAVHLACRSLLDGECELALAGAASVEAPEPSGYRFQEGWITSRDGHCRPFDARAQGTVFGSGAGLVVLERLDRALAARATIYAVIRGSAINNDGAAKVGFAAPSVEGQAAVISAAQELAGVPGDAIGYVEAHGTGTPLGDPIEIAALTRAFRTQRRGFCAIGSVKSNVGHLSRASGIAGLIKAVLVTSRGEIPASLHFERPNPQIDFAGSPFVVNAALRRWDSQPGHPRRAAVSSFGVGGTNAHLILEEWPQPLDPARDRPSPAAQSQPWQLLTLSARSADALATQGAELARHLERHPGESLADVAFTLQAGRQDFPDRRAIICRDRNDALHQLAGDERWGRRHVGSAPAVVFLFPGQGAQYVQMGGGLYESEPSFRADVDRCAEALAPQLGLDLREVLFAPERDAKRASQQLKETRMTQPALFVTEWALARLFMRWGVQPTAMIGHSIGEHAAACLSGVMSVERALSLIVRRGTLIQALPPGRMLVVHLSEPEALALCSEEISLAAVNAPKLCVLAGPGSAIEGLMARLTERQVDHHLLHTSHAFHSAMMDPALEDFTREVARHPLGEPQIPYVSGVTGTWITPELVAAPDYFSRLLRGTVRFSDGVSTVAGLENAVLLEVGPGRSLTVLAREHHELAGHAAVSSLRSAGENRPDRQVLLEALGELWLHGAPIDWEAVHRGAPRRRVPLPGHPFERREYWVPRSPVSAAAPEVARRPVLSWPSEDEGALAKPSLRAPPSGPSPLEQILGATGTDRSRQVARYLAGTINALLGHQASRTLAPGMVLTDLGIDSLASIRLRARIEEELGVAIPVVALLNGTLENVSAQLAERLARW